MRNGGGETFSAQKITLKKSMELNLFIVIFMVESHKTCKLHQFLLSAIS